jgi:hypothetical protein
VFKSVARASPSVYEDEEGGAVVEMEEFAPKGVFKLAAEEGA